MEMPVINKCDATECAYNRDEQCHAMAITVGGPGDHKCDTFLRSSKKGGSVDVTGRVGACKVESCKHNHALECSAPGITIGHEGDVVSCLTFAAT